MHKETLYKGSPTYVISSNKVHHFLYSFAFWQVREEFALVEYITIVPLTKHLRHTIRIVLFLGNRKVPIIITYMQFYMFASDSQKISVIIVGKMFPVYVPKHIL